MAILRNPKTGTKMLVPYGSKQFRIMRDDGWEDVTPKATPKQVEHRRYWKDLGNLHRMKANLAELADNSLMDDVAKTEARALQSSMTYLIDRINKEKENGKSKNNG
jgi:hypothetical protein